MKKYLTYCFILLGGNFICRGQDVINPYYNYSNPHPILNPSGEMPFYRIGSAPTLYEFKTIINHSPTNYNGEYMIQFNQLHWFKDAIENGSGGLPLGTDFKNTYYKSYKIEVIGYPFVMNGAYTTGCADNSTVRNLEMPNYPLVNNQWGQNVYRKRENLYVTPSSSLGEPADLITHNYNNGGPMIGSNQPYYPHTAHKFTVYLHCGNLATDPIVDSLVFIYDNTRGRMRDYPFNTINATIIAGSITWDVVFRPRLVYKNFAPYHSYSETTNDDIFLPGKTTDYFPFMNNNNCGTFGGVTDYFYDGTKFIWIHPAPYMLSSFLIYTQYQYDLLAGYKEKTSNPLLLDIRQGIQHNYAIQNNMDLTEINPEEKTIYNPSEVTITADNLIFPNEYTFKTIRGVYPTEAEADADNTSENAGPYLDKRRVPVRTDLRYYNSATPLLYPSDPAIPEHSVYASIYTLAPGSKVTVGSCVKIFDATFKVEQGATLTFNDYAQIKGLEDDDVNTGRFKIDGKGGAILRNYAHYQYVQNGTITQNITTPYLAIHTIEAGANTDPNSEQDDGNYSIEPGGDVTFKAGNFIHLTDGFQVAGGNFHAYIYDNTILSIPTPCYIEQITNGGGGRFANQTQTPRASTIKFKIAPNPGTGIFNISNYYCSNTATLYVVDIFGKTVYSTNISANNSQIDLTSLPKGIYLVKYSCDNTLQTQKVVLQ